MDKQPKIFVIVVTYKGMRWYDKCFTSLRESTMPVQTIVVDNTPGDEDANYIREHFPEIHIIKTEENLGFGRANNLGMRYALDNGCDYVFLLNQDAWVECDTILKMVDISARNVDYAILGCINQTKEKNHILDGFLWTITDPKNCDSSIIDDMYYGRLKELYEVKSILAAAWLLPRATLETIGGFDPIFFHYGEDDNYLQRAQSHGYKIGVCPLCPIVHDAQSGRTDLAIELRNLKHSFERNLLLEVTNVLSNKTYNQYVRTCVVHLLKSMIKLDRNNIEMNLHSIIYLLRNRRKIKNSNRINRQIGSHYL